MPTQLARRACALAVLAAAALTACARSPHSPTEPVATLDPNDLIELSVTLDQTVVTDDDGDAVALVEVTATQTPVGQRPPVSMAIVLDASGSMEGDKIEDARRAAAGLIERLEPDDRITVIGFADAATVHLSDERAGIDRNELVAALDDLVADGNTCSSCGLQAAYDILAASPPANLRRVVLLSDGHANRGLVGAGDLQAMAASAQAGLSINTASIGLGRLHNEAVMAAVAEGGVADFYFLHNSELLAQILDRELADLHSTVVSDMVVRLSPGDGVTFGAATTAGASFDGNDLVFQVGPLSLGERRRLMVELNLPNGDMGRVVRARAAFSDRIGARYELQADGRVRRSEEPDAAEASIDRRVLAEYEILVALPEVERALTFFETGRWAEAENLLTERADRLDRLGEAWGAAVLTDEAIQLRDLVEELEAAVGDQAGPEARGNVVFRRARSNEMERGVPPADVYHQPGLYNLSETQ